MSRSEISTVLTISRELHSDQSGSNSENYLKQEIDCLISDPSELTIRCLIDDTCEKSREEHNKGIEHSLKQCHCHHITIENMGHFMRNDAINLILRTLFEKPA